MKHRVTIHRLRVTCFQTYHRMSLKWSIYQNIQNFISMVF